METAFRDLHKSFSDDQQQKDLVIKLMPRDLPLLKSSIKESSIDKEDADGDEVSAASVRVLVAYAILIALLLIAQISSNISCLLSVIHCSFFLGLISIRFKRIFCLEIHTRYRNTKNPHHVFVKKPERVSLQHITMMILNEFLNQYLQQLREFRRWKH